MLMKLRARASEAPATAFEILAACHAKIRHFTALAGRIAAPGDASPDEIAAAARDVHGYFATALPLHERDEEESLHSRLAGLDPALDAALARMFDDHRAAHADLTVILDACAQLAAAPERLPSLRAPLAAAAAALAAHWEEHLALEESVVFPAITARLDAAAQAALLAEIRARREASAAPLRR